MNPWKLAGDSESSQQIALFCFLNKAEKLGFELAKNELSYNVIDRTAKIADKFKVPELRWLFHIPNGGSRGDNQKSRAIAGGLLKAEGVKSGVLDICWPLMRRPYNGLYIELKRPSLKSALKPMNGCNDEQLDFGNFVTEQGYYAVTCYSWIEAAAIIEWYYNLG